jgi:hypothetical protein
MNNKIEPIYVSFEQAKWLKEKGFDVPCREGWYVAQLDPYKGQLFPDDTGGKHEIEKPEQHQVVEWLLQNHRLDIIIKYPKSKTNKVEGINSVYYDLEIYRLQGGDAHKLYKFIGISDKKQSAYSTAFDYIKDNNLI